MLKYVMLPAPLKRSYGNKAERYSERMRQNNKPFVIRRQCENYSCGVLKVYSMIPFGASLAFVTQLDEMVVNSVHPYYTDDVTNYMRNTGCHV